MSPRRRAVGFQRTVPPPLRGAGPRNLLEHPRFPEAYGRLIALADAGHAASADLALWMYKNGPAVFGKDWDSTPEQLKAWAALTGKPEPAMLPSSYPQSATLAGRAATAPARRAGPVPALHLPRGPSQAGPQPSRGAGRP